MGNREITEIERLIRRDPARRGLISAEIEGAAPLLRGHLGPAAIELARHGRRVGIITGFFVPAATPPAAETDGPPGAILLAMTLEAVGIPTVVVTDSCCHSAVQWCARASGYPQQSVHAVPEGISRESVCETPAAKFLRECSHLIAVERVGPSHTPESIAVQQVGNSAEMTRQSQRFAAHVPPDHHDRCHNMRGVIIDHHTAPLHELFPAPGSAEADGVRTIGIGDGGNEIGMGAVPWEVLAERLPGGHRFAVPCRVATDWTVLAGTSNWGAYALAAAVAKLRSAEKVLRAWDSEHQQRVIAEMVNHGPAVDGVTRRQEPTVDGLPFLTYIQPWLGIRRLLGLPDPAL